MQLLERTSPAAPAPAAPLWPAAQHCERLLELFHRWCREAEELGQRLAATEQQLEARQRAECHRRLALVTDCDARDACGELQAHCDHLAEELAHLRLALVGAAEEVDRTLSLGATVMLPA